MRKQTVSELLISQSEKKKNLLYEYHKKRRNHDINNSAPKTVAQPKEESKAPTNQNYQTWTAKIDEETERKHSHENLSLKQKWKE